MEISKPTLSEHLKHLVKAGHVTRKKDKGKKQMVTYSLNLEKISKLKGYVEQMKKSIDSEQKNKKMFFSYPKKDQVQKMFEDLTYRKLKEIKARVDYGLNPDFEKSLAVRFWVNPLQRLAETWMINECIKNEEYRKKIFDIIDKY
jgi:DNA-binding transcriptional ArsR family regulator